MPARPLRIGVIGANFGAAVHIPAFQSEGLEVVAVFSRNEQRARETAQRFGIPHAFTGYRRLLDLPDMEAVSIASPARQHYEMTMAALDAGKHVLCEKPFASNQQQARELWQKAERSGLTAMIAHEFRFASGRMRVRELIQEGYLGRLHKAIMSLVTGHSTGFPVRPLTERDATFEGGFLFSLGAHYIDCIRHWLGEVTAVTGQVQVLAGQRTDPATGASVQAAADDAFHFVLQLAGGGWAEMTGTNVAPFGPGGHVALYGSEGTIITPHEGRGFNPPAKGVILAAKAGDSELRRLPIPERLEPLADDRDDRLAPFRLLTREFVRGIETGTSLAPNFYDGYRCQQILDAVRESSATGRTIAIPAA